MQHLDANATQQLIVQLLSQEMIENSAIKGDLLIRK